jgi:hypothetical protein
MDNQRLSFEKDGLAVVIDCYMEVVLQGILRMKNLLLEQY